MVLPFISNDSTYAQNDQTRERAFCEQSRGSRATLYLEFEEGEALPR